MPNQSHTTYDDVITPIQPPLLIHSVHCLAVLVEHSKAITGQENSGETGSPPQLVRVRSSTISTAFHAAKRQQLIATPFAIVRDLERRKIKYKTRMVKTFINNQTLRMFVKREAFWVF